MHEHFKISKFCEMLFAVHKKFHEKYANQSKLMVSFSPKQSPIFIFILGPPMFHFNTNSNAGRTKYIYICTTYCAIWEKHQ